MVWVATGTNEELVGRYPAVTAFTTRHIQSQSQSPAAGGHHGAKDRASENKSISVQGRMDINAESPPRRRSSPFAGAATRSNTSRSTRMRAASAAAAVGNHEEADASTSSMSYLRIPSQRVGQRRSSPRTVLSSTVLIALHTNGNGPVPTGASIPCSVRTRCTIAVSRNRPAPMSATNRGAARSSVIRTGQRIDATTRESVASPPPSNSRKQRQ